MAALDNYRYRELEFNKTGALVDPSQVGAVRDLADTVDDLLVISHGWNNNMTEARALYERFALSLDVVGANSDEPRPSDRTLAIVGVLWPSKRFTDSELISVVRPESAAPIPPWRRISWR